MAYRSELDALGGDRLTGPYRAYRQFFQQSSVESRTTEGDASCEDGASLRPAATRDGVCLNFQARSRWTDAPVADVRSARGFMNRT